jgi:hypothetical protein
LHVTRRAIRARAAGEHDEQHAPQKHVIASAFG